MAKLTKTDREQLRSVLRQLERGFNYLMDDKTVVCRKGQNAALTMTRPELPHVAPALECFEVCKDMGSDLCGLRFAVDMLGGYLSTH